MLVGLLLALAGEAPATRLPPAIHGDFDRDGRRDVARVIRRSGGLLLEVTRASQPTRPLTVYRLRNVDEFELRRAKRGIVATACSKGLGPRSDPCPRKAVHISGDMIEFGYAEGSRALVPWTGSSFDVVWISD